MSREVWLAAAAAIIPIAAVSAAAEHPVDTRPFSPPQSPLLLTRTIRHVLHDGKAMLARRSYRLSIRAEPGGFRIDGALAEVALDGPWPVPLATLERNRPDPGMFPMHLDAGGMILPASDPVPTWQQREAISVAAGAIARLDLAASDGAQAQGFVAQLESKPYRTAWPLDLFHPAPGLRREQRRIPLGTGSGQVTTEVEARGDAASGLLALYTRKVTTDLGGDTRVVIEEWTLTPAP